MKNKRNAPRKNGQSRNQFDKRSGQDTTKQFNRNRFEKNMQDRKVKKQPDKRLEELNKEPKFNVLCFLIY